ncbi:hypothetical protein AB0I91_13870 [Actinosynnema sp. NPDC049800]
MNQRPTVLRSTLLPAQLLGEVGLGDRVGTPDPVYQLGDAGQPAPYPTLLIAVSDDSGSVTGSGGNDPVAARYREMERAFVSVTRAGVAREFGAVIHFDVGSDADVAPVRLIGRGLRRLRRGLRTPQSAAGSSELGPSLRRAAALANAYQDHETTLVVLSDFELLDPDPTATLSDLANFPGQVHAVVLGAQPRIALFDDRIAVTTVRPEDPPGAVARVLFSSLVAHRPGSRASL